MSYDRTNYVSGLGRSVPHPKLAHLYEGPFDDPGDPMCKRGWNRDEGASYSIWRNNVGDNGICKVCLRRAEKGLKGVPSRVSTANLERLARRLVTQIRRGSTWTMSTLYELDDVLKFRKLYADEEKLPARHRTATDPE